MQFSVGANQHELSNQTMCESFSAIPPPTFPRVGTKEEKKGWRTIVWSCRETSKEGAKHCQGKQVLWFARYIQHKSEHLAGSSAECWLWFGYLWCSSFVSASQCKGHKSRSSTKYFCASENGLMHTVQCECCVFKLQFDFSVCGWTFRPSNGAGL